MSPKKTFTFAIADDMKKALQLIRERDGVAEAEQIRRGVQMWLDSRADRKTERQRGATRKRS
jgi:hypothetical protein